MSAFDDDPVPAAAPETDAAPPAPALPDPNTDDAWTSTGDTPDDASVAAAKLEGRERNANGTLKPKSGNPRRNPQARVEDATAEAARARTDAEAARREAAEARAELARLKAPTPETRVEAKTPDYTRAKPTEAQVGDKYPAYADFIEDLDDWKHEQRQHAEMQTRLDTQAQAVLASARARAQAASEQFADWNDVREAGDRAMIAAGFVNPDGSASFPPAMWQAVLHSDHLGDITHYLGSHPEDCVQLARDFASLPASAATAVQKVLERLVSAGAVARPDSARSSRPSNAKAPINRVSGTASATPIDPDDLDFGPDYIAAENARERKAREMRRA
jgi:hypothetical protein